MDIDISDFKSYITKSFGLSIGTGIQYSSCINNFYKIIEKKPSEITFQDLINFFQYLYDKDYASSTMITYLASLRAYYDYLIYQGLIDRNLPREFKRRFRTPRKLPIVLTFDEIHAMIDCAYEHHPLRIEKAEQEKNIMIILATSGLRISELESMDIDFFEKTIKVYGKRQKERIIPIITKWFGEDTTLEAYEKYEPMKKKEIQQFVRRYGKEVNPEKKITPHTFRHTYATNLIREGVDIFTVKELLGHDSIKTTEVYVHLAKTDVINKLKEKGLFD